MNRPQYDARDGDGDPAHDPAAVGERSAEQPDGDGGAVPEQEAARAAQQRGRESEQGSS